MKDCDIVEMKDLSEDYPAVSKYIERLLKDNMITGSVITETMLVFEALCYTIFEQREDRNKAVTVSGFRRTGDIAVEIVFEGGVYDPDSEDSSFLTPEESILRAYADKIDYSYRAGSNIITITTKRSHLSSVLAYAASVLIAIALYTVMILTLSEETGRALAVNIVFPLEKLFTSATLMVGTPVTFLSMLKHLTDTYIIAGRQSSARRLNKSTILSSINSVFLAILSSWLLTKLLFNNSPMKGKYSHGEIDLSPSTLIPSLIPQDIISPFQSAMPYSLIILAILTTLAFCSVGKYFDRLKDAIDAAYTLFARMLAIVVYALPLFAILAVMDELLCDGYITLLYLAEMIAAVIASLVILYLYYTARLIKAGIRPVPFFVKMIPLLRENASIASAFDAVPYNIRYCAKNYGLDRKRLERSMPVLAQINLDGNCFIITMVAMLYIAMNSTALSLGDTIAVGVLVLLLSIGSPNQPGSCLVALTIVMVFVHAEDLQTIAIIAELVFGGILNLVNISGDIVTAATEEVRECGNADKINSVLKRNSVS